MSTFRLGLSMETITVHWFMSRDSRIYKYRNSISVVSMSMILLGVRKSVSRPPRYTLSTKEMLKFFLKDSRPGSRQQK